ncbi:MAG: glycosyltransferase [Nitrospirales bacterium]|nr:glycosyltransferase family 2 protein [Nitrospira sp.]MDR4501977.1 glycosyltransferase [Nitrospirales bacterium]
MTVRTAVIIPYFQRKEGVLKKCVTSAIEQKNVDEYEIIVVDDVSPVTPESELKDLLKSHPEKIRIIKQEKNMKQGRARNRALDELRPETEYVAFLDSDDVWTDDHLANAMFALDKGYDYYFTDHYQLNQDISAFERSKKITIEDHPLVEGTDWLRVFNGDLFTQIIVGNLIGQSTLVYRAKKFPTIRYPIEFTITGEEYLFWMDLAKATDKVVFSTKCECRYGEGLNVYSATMWGHERAIEKIYDDMRYRKQIFARYELNELERNELNQRIRALREQFVREVLHRLTHRMPIKKDEFMKFIKMDPQALLAFIPGTFSAVVSMVKNRIGG